MIAAPEIRQPGNRGEQRQEKNKQGDLCRKIRIRAEVNTQEVLANEGKM